MSSSTRCAASAPATRPIRWAGSIASPGAPRSAAASSRPPTRRRRSRALDFPTGDGTRELIGRLNRIALDHGGRVYLAKDALLTPETFAAMYPKLDRFRAVLAQVDPAGRFNSDMARRLGIRPGAAAS